MNISNNANEKDFTFLPEYKKLSTTLQALIDASAKGFRGIVATAITGKYLDPDYDPLNNFYSCNPRSIFEQGIFYAFQGKIPCGKSDPLNVAKNINVLDEAWASGRRPQSAAQAAVDYIRCIEKSAGEEQEGIINFFFFRLQQYAKNIAHKVILLPEERDLSHQELVGKLTRLVLEYPEYGAVPQFVVFTLLKKIYKNSTLIVKGGGDSVFETNTTSKKPADIWLVKHNRPVSLFEITVKKINKKRLDDCIQSVSAMDVFSSPIHFICRTKFDIAELGVINGSLNYNGKQFNFIDICSFIESLISLLDDELIKELTQELHDFINHIERSIKTKDGWNLIFAT